MGINIYTDKKRALGIILAEDEEEMMNRTRSTAISHGQISVIGRRRSMEDAITIAPNLVHVSTNNDDDTTSYDFFAVFDGHGGSVVAHRCKERMHDLVAENITAEAARGGGGEMDWERVMANSFARMDEEVASYSEGVAEAAAAASDEAERWMVTVGSTALVVVVGKEVVVVANCGDCRAILCCGGAALPLSRDHKPDRPDEKDRVEAAGGNIVNRDVSRILGVLAISRSIGDEYLKPSVTSEPEVQVHQRSVSDDFLIIATDGLWDVVSNDVACELVRRCLDGQVRQKVLDEVSGNRAAVAATVLTELAIARGSKDNISVIVVDFQRPS